MNSAPPPRPVDNDDAKRRQIVESCRSHALCLSTVSPLGKYGVYSPTRSHDTKTPRGLVKLCPLHISHVKCQLVLASGTLVLFPANPQQSQRVSL